MTSRSLETSRDALQQFHAALFEQTLRNARRAPFYDESLTGFANDIPLSLIHTLPLSFRQDIIREGPRAQVREAIWDVKFTGGSSGAPFPHIISLQEQDFLHRFFTTVHELPGRRYRRGILFQNTHVTYERAIATPIRFHRLNINATGSFRYLIDTLLAERFEEEQVEPYCTILCGGQRALWALTEAARQWRKPGFDNPLRDIFTYGAYLRPNLKDSFASFWSATVTDRYGLSEIIGGATEDANTGWYYFDPVSIPEVLSVKTRQPLREGIGVVVLTALAPFQTAQPLIRYWTDDLAIVTHKSESFPGRLAIRPLGRLAESIPDPDSDGWLLTPDVLFSALDERRDIGRKSLFQDTTQVLDHHKIGYPLYKLEFLNERHVQLILASSKTSQWHGHPEAITEALLDCCPSLTSAIREKRIQFSVKIASQT
ncbi:hypothetical protein ACQR1I_20735 [Bradyrhizobium sp. HKCCYLS2038]|uniref:hypothetical protein n=1 Tax=unclassified Bradyrhizobium TaxID=2631580 RepID=UPI003EC09FBF